jgi:uncharacterized protein (TIGR00661 family)
MKILYGVQATGNGHISRSRELIKALKEKGHDVHVIFSGRDPKDLWDVQDFEPFRVFKGFTFVTRKGKVSYLRTAGKLGLFSFFSDVKGFDARDYDLAVTDFEPLTARIAKRWKLTCIGVGHQYAFQHNIPVSGRNLPAMAIIKNFAPSDYPLGLHWHHFNCRILPPVVPQINISETCSEHNKIVVYLPFEDLDEIKTLLEPLTDGRFYIYAGVELPLDDRHIHIRPFSRQRFLDDLMTCEGVISNAGFELASESIHLGKKILVKPLKGQLEQGSNALALRELNLGTVMFCLDRSVIKRWLEVEKPAPANYPDVAGIIAEWISSGCWDNNAELVTRAWAGVKGLP